MADANRIANLERTVAKLRKEFDESKRSSHFGQPRQQDNASAGPKDTTTQERHTAPRQSASITHVPPSPANTHQAQDPWYKTVQGWKTRFELIAIPFAIGYAFVTFCQWRDSNRNFVVDERAWLTLVKVDYPPQSAIQQGTPIETVVNFSNTGKTPAMSLHFDCSLEMPKSTDEPRLNYDGWNSTTFRPMMGPTQTPAILRVPERETINPLSPRTLSETEADDLLSGRAYLATYCKGTFKDMYHGIHWFKTCEYAVYFKDSPAGYHYYNCVAYNDVGDGDLPK